MRQSGKFKYHLFNIKYLISNIKESLLMYFKCDNFFPFIIKMCTYIVEIYTKFFMDGMT